MKCLSNSSAVRQYAAPSAHESSEASGTLSFRRFRLFSQVLVLAALSGCTTPLWQEPAVSTKPAPTPTQQIHSTASTLHCYAGIPKPTAFSHPILVLTNRAYLAGYCEERKDPVWVCYRLFKADNMLAPPRPTQFITDSRTNSKVTSADYTGSGYDRGHMAPNYAISVCYGAQAQIETFLMSNIIPQRPQLNRQLWQRLEATEIRDYAQRFEEIWVITGPVFSHPGQNMLSGVEIPAACYKILVDESNSETRILAFMIPQGVTGTEDPAQFLCSVDEIERLTGLDFLSDLPDEIENEVEAKKPTAMW